jgi:GNAT superfamily N-acetyltransferase
MATIESRIAEVGDAERIAPLIGEFAAKFILCDFSAEGKSRFLSDHTSIAVADRIRSNFHYRITEFGDELIGVVGMRDSVHLYHLFVAEAFQGQRIARALWEQAKAECLERGNPGTFTVNSSKYAVPMYERFGFVVTGPVQDVGGVQFVPMKLDASVTPLARTGGRPSIVRRDRNRSPNRTNSTGDPLCEVCGAIFGWA